MPATGDGPGLGAESRSGAPTGAGVRRRAAAPCPDPGAAALGDDQLNGLHGLGLNSLQDLEALDTFSRLGAPAGFAGPARPATPDGEAAPLLPGPRSTSRAAAVDRSAAPLKLLVIENDTSDAQLIEELIAASGTPVELRWARGLTQAAAQLTPQPGVPGRRPRTLPVDFSCVLLDLATPPAAERHRTTTAADPLDGLRELLRLAPNAAVVVLTDAADTQLGAAAVAAGAQDFLTKDETDGPLLARALRYAVERKRADESQRRLVEAELRGQENARLQRHLLPTPLLEGAELSFTRRYRPGRRRALLGGDFYDAVRTDDGTVHVVIGDVCGHGPDEAALGVALRIAWRTLVFAGLTGQTLLTTLQHVLEHERRSDEIFATLCMLVITPGTPPDGAPRGHRRATADSRAAGGRPAPGAGQQPLPSDRPEVEYAQLYLAGHPAPLLLSADRRPAVVPFDQAGPALGLLPCDDTDASWPPHHLELRPGWSLMLYTDGLIEGRVGAGSRRLGQDGLLNLIGDHQANGLTRGRLVDSALAEVEDLNGGALTDDVAVLLLERHQQPPLMG
ncbi:SpoIIE family protein phosphatase [Kitasatospora sp. NBC_01287]|uniref:PP2C family protein-serine/threonine phosphatase n=1 Tax=Kitasatospora sp. NBC_01287 TaxID=2903573 RepID=UPI00225B834E|nr:SpoIIE family protein phosphatase [Kitasatospora sp. NBC_01287]MCX4748224.1 SpoIIE family protein phosphatase [Kitasatospora sp. NBC_01287]